MTTRISTGINGLGRFGLHLLQYWIEHYEDALFDIQYINDDFLTLQKIEQIITNDKYLRLREYVTIRDEDIAITLSNGVERIISFSNTEQAKIPWLGKPQLFLECSGKHTAKSDWRDILTGSTKQVIISATSWTADQILVYGFNHSGIDAGKNAVISYGSCTVNAYVPLAQRIHEKYKVIDSDVNVIHNVPVHASPTFDTLERRHCTLQDVAPSLLDFLTEDNFTVNYTLVPYDGVSIIDYRFRLSSKVSRQEILAYLKKMINDGALKGLFTLQATDNGPEEHKFSPFSAVLIESSLRVVGDSLYIHAYFDNENSVNRYFDIVNYISKAD